MIHLIRKFLATPAPLAPLGRAEYLRAECVYAVRRELLGRDI